MVGDNLTASGAGGMYPSELCGLIRLYVCLYRSTSIWASRSDLPPLVVPLAVSARQVLAWRQMAVRLHPEFLCNPPPSFVPLPFELAQVYRRDGQVRVVQETADVLDAFTSVSAELCR